MPQQLTLAIFGANGAVGRHAVKQAVARGHRVIAIERQWPAGPPDDDHVTHRSCDVLRDDIGPAIAGADAVLSCLGVGNNLATLADPPPLYSQGTARIAAAMEQAGLSRLIVISASFVADRNRGPFWFRLPAMVGLHKVFDQMGAMEKMLRETDLDWTALRPGWLMGGDVTAEYVVQADVIPKDLIRTRRADVAHFMLELAGSGDWSRQTPALARSEDPAWSSPTAVLQDMVG